jgi:hypothetical protein
MPSIALFIKELLSEDKYSSDFTNKIGERIESLNAAQLQGLYNHLVSTAKGSKTALWGSANRDLVNKIEGVLNERVAEATKVEKIVEEQNLKQIQKIRKEREAKREKKRVYKMIIENAHRTAAEAVKGEEAKRQSEEKVEIMHKVFMGEERQIEWYKRTAVFFVVGVVVVCAAVQDIFILLGCLACVFAITAGGVFWAQQFTIVLPRAVDESMIEMEVEKRQDVLVKRAFNDVREKERKFNEMEERDRQERKKRQAQKKNTALFEAQLMNSRRLEQQSMAEEVMARSQGKDMNLSHISFDDLSMDMSSITRMDGSIIDNSATRDAHGPHGPQADEKEGDYMIGEGIMDMEGGIGDVWDLGGSIDEDDYEYEDEEGDGNVHGIGNRDESGDDGNVYGDSDLEAGAKNREPETMDVELFVAEPKEPDMPGGLSGAAAIRRYDTVNMV